MDAQDQRPRFFEGQFLSADDLTAIIDSQRTGDARHALGAHTWGIALGLYLAERAAPGAPERVEVVLQPGFGWDGFGRPLAVARPTRLSEALFAAIPFNPAFDTPGSGSGRLVPVWLAYDEIASNNPGPGFETCASADQGARIGATFRFVVGKQAPGEQRDPVSIGTQSMAAPAALTSFDPAAGTLWDGAVPHQNFPGSGKPPRWLVPVGLVRWIARQNELGYFAKRGLKVDEHADGQIRALRHQIGTVAERIEAADGAIVLHDRFEDPAAAHRYARLLGNPEKALSYRADLVWVEGNLRVGGDAKINGGKLHLHDADGEVRNTPFYLARAGDDSPADDGKRQLRVAIGDSAQTNNKLYVGPEQSIAGATSVAPRLVVVSGVDGNDSEGRVGVNNDAPHAALEVKGDWAGNEDGALRLAGAQPTLRFEGGADVDNHKWIAQLTSQPAGALKLAHRFGNKPWDGVLYATPQLRVGIGATAPLSPLGVRAQQGDPGVEELVSLEDAGGATKWQLNLRAAAGGKHLNFAETGVQQGRLFLQAGGNVGIGTLEPQTRLHIYGARLRLQNVTGIPGSRVLDLRTDGSAVDLQSETCDLYLRSTHAGGPPDRHIVMNPMAGDGNVGVGRVPATQKLEVQGNILFGAIPNLLAVGANVALRAVIGQVDQNGNSAGSGFVSNRTGTGDYTVSFSPPFNGPPIVVATPVDALNDDNVLTLRAINAASFLVRTRDITGNDDPSAQDTAFTFIAFGAT